jgi:hypothetical protein
VTGQILLIVNVIRDTLTGCRHPDWYPRPSRTPDSVSTESIGGTHASTQVPRTTGPRR